MAAAGRGHITLDGSARMRERPIQDLVDGLNQLGVHAQCTAGTGCPPVTVNAQGLPSGKVRQVSRPDIPGFRLCKSAALLLPTHRQTHPHNPTYSLHPPPPAF